MLCQKPLGSCALESWIERMSSHYKDDLDDTVRILRPPPRVFTDALGRNVWMGEIEPLELELEQPAVDDPYNSIAELASRY